MKRTTNRAARGTAAVVASALTAGALAVAAQSGGSAQAAGPTQPALSSRDVPVITVDGLRFRDLDRDGDLTPYEDWRLSAGERASDLLARLTKEQKAGLLAHGTLATTGQAYNTATNTDYIQTRNISTFITRLAIEPSAMAEQSNAVQQIAENTEWGIPVTISTDPRNGFAVTLGQTVARVGNTAFPEAIGMGATDDPALTRAYGDVIRQEYRAVGIHEGLSPQADIATEPRWSRINGTFGSDPQKAKQQVNAYIAGMQGGTSGVNSEGTVATVKHWVGYGAQVNGYDSHYYYGRYAGFAGGQFEKHLIPFEGAFAANAGGVMPTYSILKDLVFRGQPVEQVGAGFNRYLTTDLLRGEYGFTGVTVSDFGITGNCPQICQDTRPPASFVGSWGVGMPWGVEPLTVTQRYGKAISAGVDQVGGSVEPAQVVAAFDAGLISRSRLNEAARRVLIQKFQLGLFENPFVDPARAAAVNGSAAFKAIGDAAQAKSLTLLSNQAKTLPASTSAVKKVYLSGVGTQAAQARGLTVVATPAEADLAIVRLSDPVGGSDRTDLDFKGTEADYQAFAAAAATSTPTIAVPRLDRPLVLTNVVDRADAVLANYGVTDEVLLQTIFGERSPGGKLPFELPSSMADVLRQAGDVPQDTPNALFAAGTGLSYGGGATPPATPSRFAFKKAPKVKGVAKVGRKVRIKGIGVANVAPAATKVRVHWFVGGKKVRGAKRPAYTPRRGDVGKRLKVKVTITGSTAATTVIVVKGPKVRR
ncbi:glycoside hydrolase family 3 N-terminal domain-containing protein [Nocardioides flavescens]|uniref:beta-glucosidase n=1 Tax=Nocardioides flavescens TaxID=2691959 RepID=A0A6L7F292_9ACTN|nr:glycoside hydrolase family 3 N-terminal domain-containing protein [Nocardioides flavescens]MXG90792.1 glycoside hydrolase family 3 protein [Nocardioides flavescens]